MSRSVGFWLGWCLAPVVVALVVGCGGGPGGGAEPPRAVILVSLDTVRRDVLYDALDRGDLPNLGAFASESVRFEGAQVTTPFTLPVHMSLLTGLHHVEHGVIRQDTTLPSTVPTLGESLQRAGFDTIGLYTSEWLKPEFGFARGFDTYEQVAHGPTYADRAIARAFELLDGRGHPGRPVFLFLHLFDAHSDFVRQSGTVLPYYSPDELHDELLAGLDVERLFCADDGSCATRFLIFADREGVDVEPGVVELLRELYWRGIRTLDHDLERLFEGLRARELYDDALIALFSDHGEEFREHGMFLHSQVYEPLVRVPLLVRMPGGLCAGNRQAGTLTLAEIFPLVESFAVDPEVASGRAAAECFGWLADRERTVVYQDKLRHHVWAIRSGPWKLVLDTTDGGRELYHLDRDPAESTNLADEQPDRSLKLEDMLRGEIDRLRRRGSEVATGHRAGGSVLDEAEADRLRALGYLE